MWLELCFLGATRLHWLTTERAAQFFHGLIELVGSHAEYEQQLQPYQWLQDAASPPANHFHHTLLNLTKTLALNSLYMASNRTIAALECSLLSEAYEDCLQKNADAPARSCEAAHSGLFDVCLNVSSMALYESSRQGCC